MNYSELLAGIPMFEGLGRRGSAASLAESLVERRFAAGEIIINLGDRGDRDVHRRRRAT